MSTPYQIHQMWLHSKVQKDTPESFLYPGFKDQMAPAVHEWMVRNRGAYMTIWYNGMMVSKSAVERSILFMHNKLGCSESLLFRDVWELGIVKSDRLKKYFTGELNVYLAVDILKVIPLERDELFSKRSWKLLNRHGIVFGEAANGKHFENQFMIVDGSNLELKKNILNTMCQVIDLMEESSSDESEGQRESCYYPDAQCFFNIFYTTFSCENMKSEELPHMPVPMSASQFAD